MKKLIYISAVLFIAILSCTKVADLGEAPRLFRPVIKDALSSEGNWIKASWQVVKGAASYTAEISTDTFKTITARVTLDTNVIVFENLKWEKLYQVQVRANAEDSSHNSGISILGSIKTARFPTILNIPGLSDVNDNSVKVSWTNSGATVTAIKILKASDSSEVATPAVLAADVTNSYKVVSGLNSTTSYIIFLYSGTTVRGWADFTTKASLSGNIIDLRGFTGVSTLLMDTIPDIASGSILLLKRGETYNMTTTTYLNKTLTFTAGDDLLNPVRPIILFPTNFNITAGSMIDSIVFKDLTLRGTDYTSKYVFNINTACNIGKVRFDNCLVEIFRGVFRTQTSPALIGTLEMNNCIVDSVKDYGVFNISVATSKVDNIKVTNSTIYKSDMFIASSNSSTSVLIDGVTFNDNPLGNSKYVINYGAMNVTNGITVKNCILGVGRNNAGVFTTRDVGAGTSTIITASNNYRTSDRVSADVTKDLPSIITLIKSSTQLWQDPFNGNFKIIDNTFAGRSSAGDPRWRL